MKQEVGKHRCHEGKTYAIISVGVTSQKEERKMNFPYQKCYKSFPGELQFISTCHCCST